MRKKTAITLFLLIFLVSCANPVVEPTVTVVSPTFTATVTQTPSPTETLEPTPTVVGPIDAATWAGEDPIRQEFNANIQGWGVDPASIKCEGSTCFDLEGNEIFDASTGKYEPHFLQEALANSGDLVPTRYSPRTGNVLPNWPSDQCAMEYLVPLFKEVYGEDAFITHKLGFTGIMLDPTIKAWGVITNSDFSDPSFVQYLIYRTSAGEIVQLPIMDSSRQDLLYFWAGN